MSPRRWFRPWTMFWIAYIALRHSDHPELLLSIFGTVGLVMLIVWLLKPKAKPEIAYLGPLALKEGARCLVCRDALAGEVIYCGSCHTPHHRACYSYVGGCSVYACGGRQSGRAA